MIQKVKRRIAKYKLSNKINEPFSGLKTKRFYKIKSGLGLTKKIRVPINQILIGQQSGIPLEKWIEKTKEYERISIPISASPYVKILDSIDTDPSILLDKERIEKTAYFQMMNLCIKHQGQYMGITQSDKLIEQIQYFYDLYKNFNSVNSKEKGFKQKNTEGRSQTDEPIKVKKIYYSDAYEVVDGHHRLAILYKQKTKEIEVEVLDNMLTYLQKTILKSQQTFGIELYQPLDKLEVLNWTTIRKCDDRLSFMQRFLKSAGLNSGSYLDFPCSYGYFVKGMKELGWQAKGYDIDKSSVFVANNINKLSEVKVNNIIEYLKSPDERFDVVSCLSLIHHFAMNRINYPYEEILKGLDKITKKVLILDTGQGHEKQYKGELDQWNDEFIINEILKHTSFTKVIALGKDADDTGKNEGKNGRTLFACTRN